MLRPISRTLVALASLAGPAAAQSFTLPELGFQNTGSCRQLAARDRTNNAMVSLGCLDTVTHGWTLTPNSLQIQGVGSTGSVDGMSVTPPGRGTASTLSSLFDGTMSIATFGAKDDNATDNTAAVQSAVNAASALGRTLRVAPTTGGTGQYRIGPGITWQNVNLDFDEGAGFVNLDGSTYSGTFYTGALNLPGIFDPFRLKVGRRIHSPGADFLVTAKPATNKVNDVIYNGIAPYTYSVTEGEQSYFLGGQSSASSGSWAGKTIYGNIYNYSNGPGIQMTCSFTQNSQYGTSCSPSPTGINPATNLPYLTGSSVKITGAGVPAGAFVDSWDGGAIAMATGTLATPVGWTAASGTYTVTVTPFRSEFNPLSLAVSPVGTAANGGPQGGMNWYNESTMRSAIGTAAADQEGALFSWLVSATKSSPGNLRDKLHNGSAIIAAVARPDDTANASRTYPLDDGIAITGWSGAASLSGGSATGATYGAFNGLRVGGICTSVYCNAPSRSFFKVGINVQDYETGIRIENPAASYTGTSIYTASGAGNVDIRDNLIVGTSIIEPNPSTPASSTSPCTAGQRAWDRNYEYRCVATNRWRRISFASDWP